MKIIKTILPYIIIVIVVVIIRIFLITPAIVNGNSMNSTLNNNDVVIIKKYDKSYDRFDVVVFTYQKSRLVKRIIGLPGEHVKYENGKLYINGEVITDNYSKTETNDFDLTETEKVNVIPDGYYFVMGDNRTGSADSRVIGLIPESDILGTTSLRIWPLNKIGTFK